MTSSELGGIGLFACAFFVWLATGVGLGRCLGIELRLRLQLQAIVLYECTRLNSLSSLFIVAAIWLYRFAPLCNSISSETECVVAWMQQLGSSVGGCITKLGLAPCPSSFIAGHLAMGEILGDACCRQAVGKKSRGWHQRNACLMSRGLWQEQQ